MSAAVPINVTVPISDILAAAARDPSGIAMRHKRRGQWRAWTHGELAAQTHALAQALRDLGVGHSTRVAVSGDFAPNLVLFAIAAARAGAYVVPVPIDLPRAALAEWLTAHPVQLAFLGLRDLLGAWRAALASAGRQSHILVDFHLPWGHVANAGVTAAADLLGPAPNGRVGGRAAGAALWIEEGTEWPDGLAFLLHALSQGAALAFPESRAAAGRDRREVQPSGFALSAAHHAALQRQLASRLHTGNGWTARWTRSALAAGARPASWHQRWLLGRLRQPFGLARLRDLTVVGDAPAAIAGVEAGNLIAALGIPARHAAIPGGAAVPADLVFA